MTCCATNIYDETFDTQTAETELSEYQAGRLKKNSRPLLDALMRLPLEGSSLLDIGGGIGAITFELLKQDIHHAVHVDISSAYVQAFLKEAKARNVEDRISAFCADFMEVSDQIQQADLVVLDKVICCYQDYENLVRASSSKSSRWYAYSIPRDNWWSKLWHQLQTIKRGRNRKPCNTFFHPVAHIESLVAERGFKKIEQLYFREWTISIFEKINSKHKPL